MHGDEKGVSPFVSYDRRTFLTRCYMVPSCTEKHAPQWFRIPPDSFAPFALGLVSSRELRHENSPIRD